MAGQQKDIVEHCVTTVLADIKKFALEEFEKLEKDSNIMHDVVHTVKAAVTEFLKLVEEFRTEPTENIEERLLKHLPKHRVDLIKTGLQVPTYQVNIAKRSDGHHWADIVRDGKPFMESRKLDTTASINKTKLIQIASIIIEAVLLVLQAVGIKADMSEQVIQRTAKEVEEVVESSGQLQKAVAKLVKAAGGDSKWEIAKAIFQVIKDSKAAGILWKIIKGLCHHMSWWDWMKTAGIVTAMIVTAVATDGAALIAKIVLALKSAHDFYKKVRNLQFLEDFELDSQLAGN